MPIQLPPSQPELPASPPALIEPASQQQSQSQEQFNSPNLNSSNTNNAGANSVTESTGVLNQSGSLSNYQINNSSSSEFSFSPGVAAPVPTISINSYSHSGSNGIAATLTIPLGGAVSKQHRTLVNSRIKRIDLDNSIVALQGELELATACAKIAVSGAVINYSQFPLLSRCQFVTIRSAPPTILLTPPPPIQILIPPVKIIEPPIPQKPISPPKRPVRGLY